MKAILILVAACMKIVSSGFCPANYPTVGTRERFIRWQNTSCDEGGKCSIACSLTVPNLEGFSPSFLTESDECPQSVDELEQQGYVGSKCTHNECILKFNYRRFHSVRCVFNNTLYTETLYHRMNCLLCNGTFCEPSCCSDGSCFSTSEEEDKPFTLASSVPGSIGSTIFPTPSTSPSPSTSQPGDHGGILNFALPIALVLLPIIILSIIIGALIRKPHQRQRLKDYFGHYGCCTSETKSAKILEENALSDQNSEGKISVMVTGFDSGSPEGERLSCDGREA